MNHTLNPHPLLPPPRRVPAIKKLAIVLSVMATIAGTLTGIMSWANVGLTDALAPTWLRSFVTAMVVMVPLAGLLMVALGGLVQRVLPTWSALHKNLLIGLTMSVVMQSIMAAITGFNAVGLGDMTQLKAAWTHAFTTAFPVGLMLALTLTTVVKPRLERLLSR